MSKLDPQLANLISDFRQTADHNEARKHHAAALQRGAADAAPKVKVLLKLSGDIDNVLALGFEVASRAGDILVGSVGVDKVEQLAALPNVVKIDISRQLSHELDTSVPEILVPPLHSGTPPLRGAGVVIGIIDTGIDYKHACFRTADNKSRILFIWDQTLTPNTNEKHPDNFGFGVEWTKAQIDAALASQNPRALVRHEDTSGHGTHVAGIAAGNGAASGNCRDARTFVGVAPEADLIVVKNSLYVSEEREDLGDSFNLMTAVDYIFQQAAKLGKPAVINMSQGDTIGSHDGTSLAEQFIDKQLAAAGRAMVKSAGNELLDGRHASGKVAKDPKDGPLVMFFEVKEGQSNRVVMELWYDTEDRFAVTLKPPGGTATQQVNPLDPPEVTLSNRNIALIRSGLNDSENHDNRINIELRPGELSTVQPGTWTLTVIGTTVASLHGTIHGWISKASKAAFTWLRGHPFPGSDPDCTITLPGTAFNIITVGAYSTKPGSNGFIRSDSSHGPTRDGRLMPDLTAPGDGIMSARSSDVPTTLASLFSPCCADEYISKGGTSMAAPHVSGVVALMLQKNPSLTSEDIRKVLCDTARRDTRTGTDPNNTYGYGKLNAQRAVNPASATLVGPAPTPSIPPPTPQPGFAAPAGQSPPAAIERLRQAQAELLGTAAGQRYAALMGAHIHDVRVLIATNRRVAVAWQRLGSSAMLQAALEALSAPDRPLPLGDDQPLSARRLRRFLDALRRYGSVTLRDDIDRYGAELLAWEGLSYNQVLTRLRAVG